MITIVPHTALPAPAEETLQKFQKNHSLTLPPEYLAFLRIANCGEPVEKLFDIPGNTKVVERFLGIIEGYQTHPLGQYDAGVTHSQVCERFTDDPDQVGYDSPSDCRSGIRRPALPRLPSKREFATSSGLGS